MGGNKITFKLSVFNPETKSTNSVEITVTATYTDEILDVFDSLAWSCYNDVWNDLREFEEKK